MKRVIDLSKHNVITSWAGVKASCDMVVLRIGFRGYTTGKISMDPKLKENLAAAQKIGLPVGFYFFPCSITDQEAIEEADFCAEAVKGLPIILPLFADSEISDVIHHAGRSDHLSVKQRTHLLKVFCDRLQEKGIPAGIYASTSWLNTKLDMSQLPYTVWVAQYAPACKYTGKYLLWQFTSKANVLGVLKPCDMSYVIDAAEKNPYREPSTTVKKGDTGAIVKWVQWYVRVNEDGDFGDKTEAEVIAYQKKAFPKDESEWDGVVGPHTRTAFKKNGRA